MKNLQFKVCIFCAETVKEFVQLHLNLFFYVEDCVAASENIWMFFNERAAASEKILTTASEIYWKKKCATASEKVLILRKIMQLLLGIMST